MDPHLTRLRRIATQGGDVFHGLKASEPSFAGFGEAYFTTVHHGVIKGWKRHRRMQMNLVVPAGEVQFVLHDETVSRDKTLSFRLSPDREESYNRLAVPPGWWMAFSGIGPGLNLVLNLASIEHDPQEAESRPFEALPWIA